MDDVTGGITKPRREDECSTSTSQKDETTSQYSLGIFEELDANREVSTMGGDADHRRFRHADAVTATDKPTVVHAACAPDRLTTATWLTNRHTFGSTSLILDYKPPTANVFMFTTRPHSLAFTDDESGFGVVSEASLLQPPNVKRRHSAEKKALFRRAQFLRQVTLSNNAIQKAAYQAPL
eukprot:CAMPEP_0118926140 /NCGR_PEP_ID=MMETSP1169-20130426/3913_1 /TAXON_ID=36882 /ORGANISM="Pyramimonas obovata, Strain CCMP722" /LENGTH=179 /DNA_ID=CAMNT_0006867637 /DNA_START=145 /DNA_END=683 /DNA_ORIENTATION=-